MDVSIIFATYKRNNLLHHTLNSFISLITNDLEWEIIVVDNDNNIETSNIIDKYKVRLPIRYLSEPKPGKNCALNSAIPHASGTLIVFTDDDIIADENWLIEMWEGSKRWPNNMVFGGCILPKYPLKKKPPALDHSFIKTAYAVADWNLPEGEYNSAYVWGPNMAVRSAVFKNGWKFDEAIGPTGDNYIVGSETEFTMRLEKAGFNAVYLPRSLVHHQIRAEQLEMIWLYKRAFRAGRGNAYKENSRDYVLIFGIPRFLYRELLVTYIAYIFAIVFKNKHVKFGCAIKYWVVKGKFYQYAKGIKPKA